jgi:hypothetical protein
LSDGDEVNVHGTDPHCVDSDFDELSDGDEVNLFSTAQFKAERDPPRAYPKPRTEEFASEGVRFGRTGRSEPRA